MKRLCTALTVLAATLAAAAPAHAGSYEVVACGAPGAGGANHSWTPRFDSLNSGTPDASPYYEFDDTCAGGLVVRSRTVDGTRAPWLTSASWAFDAPAGTQLTKVTAWRYGEARDDRDETSSDDGDHWEVASFANGQHLDTVLDPDPDTCHHGAGVALCTVGSAAGMSGPARTHQVAPTSRITYSVGCGGTITDGCQTSYATYPLASYVLYGMVVTVSDDSKPSLSTSGPLTGDGWHRADATVAWSASDNVGIRRVRLLLDGTEVARDESSCDFTQRVPCPGSRSGSLGLAGAALADGAHQLSVVTEDTAGNTTQSDRTVSLDVTAPRVGGARVARRSVSVGVRDRASGVASGTIEVLRRGAWQALPTTLARGRLRARAASGSLRGKALRATITDAAGNVAAGQLTRLRVTGRRPVAFGRPVRLRLAVRTLDGRRAPGATLHVDVREHRVRAPFGALTDAAAPARVALGPGVSRVLRVTASGAGLLPRVVDVVAGVRAAGTIHASRTRLAGPGTVRFAGRLRTAGARIPPSGKIVELQGFDRGRWRTFATARARGPKGRWHASNRFSGRPGTYPVRLRIRRESAYPFALGTSRAVRIRVG